MKTIFATLTLLTASSLALAQQTPPPLEAPGPGPGGPPAERRDDDRPGPGGGGAGGPRGERPLGPGMRGGPGMMGPGGAGPGGGPGGGECPRLAAPHAPHEHLRNYLGVIDSYARLSRDPNQAGIAAVVTAADILRPRGAEASIEYFTKLLPEVKSPAVQRAVRLQLVDMYKATGKADEALAQLREVMKGAPETEPTPPARPPQP